MSRFYSNTWKVQVPVAEVLAQARKKAEYHTERMKFWKAQEELHNDPFANMASSSNSYTGKVNEHEGLVHDFGVLVRFLERVPAGETLEVNLGMFEELGF